MWRCSCLEEPCLNLLPYIIGACIVVPLSIIWISLFITISVCAVIICAVYLLLIRIPVKCFLYIRKRFCDRDLEAANEIEIWSVPDIRPSIREFGRQISSITIRGVNDDPPNYEEHDRESDYLPRAIKIVNFTEKNIRK